MAIEFTRIGNTDPISTTIAEAGFDQVTEVRNIDHDVADPRRRQCDEMPFDERDVANFD